MARQRGGAVFSWICAFALMSIARYAFNVPLIAAAMVGLVGYYAVAPGLLLLGMKITEHVIKKSPGGAALIEAHKAEQAAAWKELDSIKKRQAAGEKVDPMESDRVEGILFRNEGVLRKATSPVGLAWEAIVANADAAGFAAELKPAIKEVLIPMRVNPQSFLDNLAWLETGGFELMFHPAFSKEPTSKPNPTPSIAACPHRAEWPMSQPQWFIAAFPDVSKWASKTLSDAQFNRSAEAVEHANLFEKKIEQLFERAGIRESDNEEAAKKLMYDAQGKTSPAFGKLLVEWYVEATGRDLETGIR